MTVGSFRYLVRPRPEPPSACGILPPAERGERRNGGYAQVSCGGEQPLRMSQAEGEGAVLRGCPDSEHGAVLPLSRCATAPPRGEQWTPQYCANHERGTGSERVRDGKSRYAGVMRRALFITVGSVLVVLLMIILLQTGLGVDSDVTITDRNRPEIVGSDDD